MKLKSSIPSTKKLKSRLPQLHNTNAYDIKKDPERMWAVRNNKNAKNLRVKARRASGQGKPEREHFRANLESGNRRNGRSGRWNVHNFLEVAVTKAEKNNME